jgi:hypothetical protein
MIEEGITLDRLYNADQTGVFYEYIPKKTINAAGAKTIWIKCGGKDKKRATVMLLGSATGEKKTSFIVLKAKESKIKDAVRTNRTERNGFGVRLWPEIQRLQESHDCRIYGNPTAWWNTSISIEFLKYHFAERNNRNDKLMLLWDDFSAHFTSEVVEYAESINVVLMKVPPRFTWACQPADLAWNKPLKCKLRSLWVSLLRDQLARHIDPEIPFKLVPPSRGTLVEWVVCAWSGLSSTIIINGFKKAKLLEGHNVQDNEANNFARDDNNEVDDTHNILERIQTLDISGCQVLNTADDFFE